MSSLLTDRDLEILEAPPARDPAQPARRGMAPTCCGSNRSPRCPVGQPGEALRRRPGPPRRHRRRRSTTPTLGPDRGRRPGRSCSRRRPARSPGRHRRSTRTARDLRERLAASAGLPATTATGGRSAHPLEGVRDRRVRHVLRLALRQPPPVGPRRRRVKVEPHRRRPDAPPARAVRGRQPGQAQHRRRPEAPDAARPVLDRARARGADIVQHNLRPGVAERLGIDYAPLRALNPDLDLPLLARATARAGRRRAAELRPAAVGVRRAVRHRRRRRQPAPRHVRQRGLLQRAAQRAAPACSPWSTASAPGEGQYVESPQLHSSVFTTSEYYKRRRRVPLGHPPPRRRAVRLGDRLPAVPVPRRLDLRDVHRGRPGRRAGPRRAAARRATPTLDRASCGPIYPR